MTWLFICRQLQPSNPVGCCLLLLGNHPQIFIFFWQIIQDGSFFWQVLSINPNMSINSKLTATASEAGGSPRPRLLDGPQNGRCDALRSAPPLALPVTAAGVLPAAPDVAAETVAGQDQGAGSKQIQQWNVSRTSRETGLFCLLDFFSEFFLFHHLAKRAKLSYEKPGDVQKATESSEPVGLVVLLSEPTDVQPGHASPLGDKGTMRPSFRLSGYALWPKDIQKSDSGWFRLLEPSTPVCSFKELLATVFQSMLLVQSMLYKPPTFQRWLNASNWHFFCYQMHPNAFSWWFSFFLVAFHAFRCVPTRDGQMFWSWQVQSCGQPSTKQDKGLKHMRRVGSWRVLTQICWLVVLLQ